MGTPSGQYTGQPLANNVQGAYTSALGQSGAATDAGNTALNTGSGFGTQAGGIYTNMGGMTPSDVTSGQLSTTDLSPYMNPYISNVVDTTMGRLNREEGVSQQGIDDSALAQGAFGGDRMYLQKGRLGEGYANTKASTLADLYSKGFDSARSGAQFDIGNKLNADTFNTDYRSKMMSGGASGLGNLAQGYGALGSDMSKFGTSNLGTLANMGFGMGDALQKNQLAAGALQQQQQQQLIDAIHAQYLGYTGAPANSLSAYLGAILNPSGYGKTQSNPGLLSYLGAGLGAAGTVAGFF